LRVCQEIETALGRVRTVKDGPRTLDIDILLYGDVKLNGPDLVIPHPRMRERDFVMRPLSEVMERPVRADFDERASSWDEDPRRVRTAREIADALFREIPLSGQETAVDLGCGTGLLTLALAPRVRRVMGVDSSTGMLKVLKDKVRAGGIGNVETRLLDLGKGGPLPTGFDLLVSSMTLHHVLDVPGLLRDIFVALRSQGRVALADLDTEDGSFHSDNTGVLHFGFDRNGLIRELEAAGFLDVRAVTATRIEK
ncbi:MAG: 2-amino-4-hydroxy-6-hydroxymethyldihydropteridine diphosphokinase, partial [Elusimicrobia bacterium]|nr:2-amino-4-hydroxy-6-hydroxymethyldihydropteridine diphosphokinase [Elusimicrobiota bacterium]